jgi:hypothetical protein
MENSRDRRGVPARRISQPHAAQLTLVVSAFGFVDVFATTACPLAYDERTFVRSIISMGNLSFSFENCFIAVFCALI